MRPMTAISELATILRPAGGGLHLVSTGKAAQLALQRRIYGAATDAEVDARWKEALARVPDARIAILGIPSDVGAGFLRGANIGPQAIRTALLDEEPAFASTMTARGIVDLGDVFVVPQLLHDDMLSEPQLAASRRALYPKLSPDEARKLPVSPLSIAERALDRLFEINPNIAPVLLGGDHSTAWPAAAAIARARGKRGDAEPWAIVQIDAHTDMLEERLGIKYCFATWSFHASRLFDRPDKMVQVGIRASGHPRSHWESNTGIRQFWADEANANPAAVTNAIVDHLRSMGVTKVYFSNDIDGTDEAFADATGTPEPGGLHPDFVTALVTTLGKQIGLLGGDVMEVAPPIARTPGGGARTVSLAVRYLKATLDAILG
jgi:agmatinase